MRMLISGPLRRISPASVTLDIFVREDRARESVLCLEHPGYWRCSQRGSIQPPARGLPGQRAWRSTLRFARSPRWIGSQTACIHYVENYFVNTPLTGGEPGGMIGRPSRSPLLGFGEHQMQGLRAGISCTRRNNSIARHRHGPRLEC
jgi:hypothetical protein